jgi:3'(2'), 5'-bisphosphate nucleotidase
MGVVHVPVKETTYWGDVERAEAKKVIGSTSSLISVRKASQLSDPELIVVASRRHGSEALERLLAQLNSAFRRVHLTSMGSSLKLCLIAEGQADFYPRLAPTSEWDTAAAHAVVSAAGGEVLNTLFQPLRYNTKSSLLNPHFLVLGDRDLGLQPLVEAMLPEEDPKA